MEAKTHWKKNLDSKFISGEDLKSSLNNLSPEMAVVIDRFSDDETFDANKSAKTTITGLYLKDLSGKKLYKPTILNKTNAKFFTKEFGSDYMEDWVNKPVTMFAQADSRHGFVVRFRKYKKPSLLFSTPEFEKCKIAIDSGSYTIDQVKTKYTVSAEVEKLLITK